MSFAHMLHHWRQDTRRWFLNFKLAGRAQAAAAQEYTEFILTTPTRAQLQQALALHAKLALSPIPGWLKSVLHQRRRQLTRVALNHQGRVIAYEFFMFNEAETPYNFIHEFYIGVDPAWRGRSLSVKLRQFSFASYKQAGFAAMSMLSPDNMIACMRSAQKAGFAIIKRSAKPPAWYLVRRY